MKTIKMEFEQFEAAAVRDALNNEAIALRTSHLTGVVMPEKVFFGKRYFRRTP